MLKEKKVKVIVIIFLLIVVVALFGYYGYCHYMVSKFYKYIDAGDTEGAISCVEKMPDVNMLDTSVPIFYLRGIFTQHAFSREYPLCYAIDKKADISIIEALLARGADPNKKNLVYPTTPLYCLCINQQEDMYEKVTLLVVYGADIRNEGYIDIPASWEEMTEDSKEEIFRTIVYLWENGVDAWHAVDTKYERSILHIAAERFELDYLEKMYKNQKRPMNELLDALDANGETPLFYAVRAGKFDNCSFLIEEGANINIQNNEGKTAYDIAIELGYTVENTFTETTDNDISTVEEVSVNAVEQAESYIDAYIDLSEDTEVEGYEWVQYDNAQVLRIKIQYKEPPVNNYRHKEDHFLFITQDEKVSQILLVDYEDKGIHVRLSEGTECINNHLLGEGCNFEAHFEDVTFDNQDDLLISLGNSRHAEYYCVYVYENGGFRYEKTFEHIPNYEVDIEKEVIYGSDTDGMGMYYDTSYEYKNGEFLLIEDEVN